MIDIGFKDLYKKQDNIPKKYRIHFPALSLTIENNKLVSESFSLNETLCASEDLKFGECNAAQVKFTIVDIDVDLTYQWFTVTQIIDDNELPLGEYKVYNCKQQSNKRCKDITSYDRMKETDVDVAEWYNSMFLSGNEKYTLKQFRESLLDYLGIEYEDETLPNDGMIVEKTIDVTQISGREVLQKCVELNGAFGHINRYGKFEHVILEPGYGLYPSEDLYPSNDLYPVDENNTTYINENLIDETVANSLRRRPVEFEEYTVQEIDKLIIRTEEDDIGSIVGTGSNTYIIQDNFLVYGKSASELEQITRNAYGNMAKRPYRPYKAEIVGLPYIEVGDTLLFTGDNPITGYVLQRTLFGIQALKDEIITQGKEKREQNFNINTEIIRQKGRIARIKKDVDGVLVEVEDIAQELYAGMSILAGQVVLKVDASGNVAAVELGADPSQGTSIKIKADNISLEGLVTANGYFKILPDGSMEATNGKFSGQLVAASGTFTGTLLGADGTFTGTLSGNTIVSPNISGGNISGTVITSSGAGVGSLEINGAYIRGRNAGGSITLDIWPGGIDVYGNLQCNTINGYAPINAGNIGSQSVSYASNAGTAFRADVSNYIYNNALTRYAYISVNDNFIGSQSTIMYIGSSGNPWAGGYGVSGWVTTSDERLKENIKEMDERYLKFIKKLVPKVFKMKQGTSGRFHTGFIAQEIEKIMNECGISDIEFAGLVKAPIYEGIIKDNKGNIIGYDEDSTIIDYTYHLRYEELIAPILLYLKHIDERITKAGF